MLEFMSILKGYCLLNVLLSNNLELYRTLLVPHSDLLPGLHRKGTIIFWWIFCKIWDAIEYVQDLKAD